MRKLKYILSVALFALASCTAPRKLAKGFTEKPIQVSTAFKGESYANNPSEIPRRYTVKAYTLWDQLSFYNMEPDTASEIPEEASIRLSWVENDLLQVRAYQEEKLIASFDISVRKKGKYLILKKKRKMIPIPIIYFEIKEDITILAPLEKNRIGFYSYSDETLAILFFGASKTSRSISEYEQIKTIQP